ncbi:MAG: glycosyltransferase, partial [Methylococcaceae bacterium]|nr:glycosyltransferase [Methylococcaceae bacterium]
MHADHEQFSGTTPKVSVTVITYNHGNWLAQCLESIVTQETDFPFEVIVGDDASTDGRTVE